ncbi:pyridoxal phosphate-dependent transferase [Lipomyces tetrasporus]|uniref:serine C-palmitoyltransferase n=1 Tax=Lipomyces tetrasporus TaxID=54092 RepID=A0AAD7QPW0_9ASCO|nr:pyridoxal phosphate-dependent transferase [Lipomyces tetrasporus]KAJ8099289.1 pyridoxal phosphate-dependent transferase [Lipomyces tetrasporus]
MPSNQTKLASLFAQAQAQIQLPSSGSAPATSASSSPVAAEPSLPSLGIINYTSGTSTNNLSPEEVKKRSMQFAPLSHPSHRYVPHHPKGKPLADPVEEEAPLFYLLTTYISYLILIIFGHVRDFFGKRFKKEKYSHLIQQNGYAPLNSDFDSFYIRRLQARLGDCFARPTIGVPGRYVTLLDRVSKDHCQTFSFTGTTTDCLNLSSYNYLGFAQSEGQCADAAEEIIRRYGTSTCSPRAEAGTTDLHIETEELIARFVGKEAAMVFSMGYATNAAAFPSLVSKGCLIISDELNHASIRFGARLSGAVIKTYKHNNMADLEHLLRDEISQGQPRTHRPWKKILVVVEGLYSMEGTMCNLPVLVALKKKYKFYLFVDEAHSIGAIGPNGRGVCDYFGIDPGEVDILMGTLTKSFGATGGYIAADKAIIDALKLANLAYVNAESMSPPVLAQIEAALHTIIGEIVPGEGEERLQRLSFNSRYLRLGLKRLGFITYGHDDSPIIPLLLYSPAKMPAFSHEMLRRKIAVVVVAYPATPLVTSRVRFCVSAALNKDDLDTILRACDELGDILMLKFSSGSSLEHGEKPRWKVEDVIRKGVIDAKRDVL